MRLGVVAAGVMLVACQAGSQSTMKPPGSSKGLTVDVTSGTKAFAVAERLRETAPGKPCAFVAGDVPPDVAVAPVRLRTGSGVVDAGLVCGDGVEGMLRPPTVHDGVMIGFARGAPGGARLGHER